MVTVIVLVMTGFSATAGAAPSWTRPVTLGPTGRVSSPPQIAVTPDGEAVATWDGGRSGGIRVSSRPPGKGWTPAVTLATSGSDEPQVAATARKAVVVWNGAGQAGGYETSVIMAATRPRGRRWSRPRNISPEKRRGEETEGREPRVTITRRGKAIAIWTAGDERHQSNSFIRSTTQSAKGTDWAAPIGIPDSIEGEGPEVGATPAGEAVALWGAEYNEESGIEAAALPARGDWSAVRRLAHPGGFPQSQLAITSRGEAIGAWVSGPEGEDKGLQVATRKPGSLWKVRTLAPHDDAYHPTIVTRPGGRATVVWVRTGPSGADEVVTATHSPDGNWTAPVSLDAEGLKLPGKAYPEIAVTDEGESMAVWSTGGERRERTIIQASSRSRGGSWRAPTNISSSPPAPMFGTADLKIAVAPNGEAFAIWRSFDGRRWVTRAATRPAASSP